MADINVFRGWADTIRQDIEAFKALLESDKADAESRRIAGAALLYQVGKLDLIPDWNEGIGVIDDVMVLRVCAQLTQSHVRGPLPTPVEVSFGRMSNEADQIVEFLGSALFDKLKAYCAKLSDQEVRGRTPAQLIDDPALRTALAAEIDDDLKKTVPVVVNEPVDAELRLKAYLTHKLQ